MVIKNTSAFIGVDVPRKPQTFQPLCQAKAKVTSQRPDARQYLKELHFP